MVIRASAASASCLLEGALGHEPGQGLLDGGAALAERLVGDVAQHHLVPGDSGHLGDAGAHQSGSDDGESLFQSWAGEPNRATAMGETGRVPDWITLMTSVVVVGVLALLLRWAYGGRQRSLVERRPTAGGVDDYGLMVVDRLPRHLHRGRGVPAAAGGAPASGRSW